MMQMLLRHGRTWYCAVVAAFLLTACAAPQKIGGNASEAAFERAGRFDVTVNYFGGKHEAVQGGFAWHDRSEEHTSELQSLMRISYAIFCLKKKNQEPNKDTQLIIQVEINHQQYKSITN